MLPLRCAKKFVVMWGSNPLKHVADLVAPVVCQVYLVRAINFIVSGVFARPPDQACGIASPAARSLCLRGRVRENARRHCAAQRKCGDVLALAG